MKKINILFVEDNKSDAELIWHEILKSDIRFEKYLVETEEEYLAALKSFKPELVVSDYSLPQFDGMQALLLRNKLAPSIPFILVTGSVNEEVAVECMKTGADDYILKQNLSRLGEAIKSVLNKKELVRQRELAEKLLRENEEKLSSIFRVAPTGIGLVKDRIIAEVNPMVCEMTGYGSEELIGKSARILYPSQEEFDFVGEVKDKQISDNGLGILETRWKRKDGRLINIILASTPLSLKDLSLGITFTALDITRRKEAEDALRRSRKEFQSYFDTGTIGMSVTLPDKTWKELNQKLCLMFGYTKKEMMEITWVDLSHPDDLQADLDLFQQALNGKIDSYELDKRFIRKDGSIIYVTLSVVCVRNDDGTPHHFLSSYIDITERKQFEDLIQRERLMLRTLIDNLPDVIYVKDIDGRKIIANRADTDSMGLENESQAIGKTDLELFQGEIGQRGYDVDMTVLKTGISLIDHEEDFFDKNDIQRWLQTSKIPIFDSQGKATGLVGIGHDITERKISENELMAAKEKAEESDKLKTAFLHNISHEIRTPMNAIVGFCSLLAEQDTDQTTRNYYIDIIMKSSNQLLAIISDIIDISNIEANIVKINKKGFLLNYDMSSLFDQFLPEANERMISLKLDTGLADEDSLIQTDSTKLIQIISNLLNNAFKFTKEGTIAFGYSIKNDLIEFFVSDTGMGIPFEQHQKIFDRFYQVENPVSKLYEGTGLGLSICKAYVELLGGSIWLSSVPDTGSTFYFTIPHEKPADILNEPSADKKEDEFAFPENVNILVAEDIDSNFKLIKYFVSKANITIIRASNGEEAVNIALSNENISLILMDIKMPVMDGFTAARLIHESKPHIPIIAQTAYIDDKSRAFEFGCSGFISKPFDKKRLLSVIKEYI